MLTKLNLDRSEWYFMTPIIKTHSCSVFGSKKPYKIHFRCCCPKNPKYYSMNFLFYKKKKQAKCYESNVDWANIMRPHERRKAKVFKYTSRLEHNNLIEHTNQFQWNCNGIFKSVIKICLKWRAFQHELYASGTLLKSRLFISYSLSR